MSELVLEKGRKYVQSSVQVQNLDGIIPKLKKEKEMTSDDDLSDYVSTEKNTAEYSAKIKRNRYTYLQKQEILQDSKILTSNMVCEKYDLNIQTLRKWKAQEEKISDFSTEDYLKNAKKARITSKLDNQLHCWLLNTLQRGIPISGPILKKQAIVINKKNGGPKDFRASNGWLDKWKKRMNVKNLNITGEKLSADEVAAKKYKEDFAEIVKMHNLDKAQIFNMDESGLQYKITLKKSFVPRDQAQASGMKKQMSACEVVDKEDQYRGLDSNGMKQIEETYLYNFHEAILACLLYGAVPCCDQKIELQTSSYSLNSHQEVYPSYLSNMIVNPSVAIRAHAITLLHKMITDDPVHAVKLLPLIAKQFDKTQNKLYFGDSLIHRVKNRIMQVLLMLQPILPNPDIESLHRLMCADILSERSQHSVRIMQEWILIRIYLDSETLRAKIWQLIDQGQEKGVGNLCSVVSVIYHVARLLPSDLQPDFIDLALHHIMPCCMAQQYNLSLYAQVVASKLYDLATERFYSIITHKYSELYIALKKSLKNGYLIKNSIKLQDDFYFTVFNPKEDYSLQTLFYELPRLSNFFSDEHILPQIFENYGFKKSNSHPIKLLTREYDVSEALVSKHVSRSSGSTGPAADEPNNSAKDSTDRPKKFIPCKSTSSNDADKLSEMFETFRSHQKAANEFILVASLIEKLPNLSSLRRTCEILGVREFAVASIKNTEDREFQSLSVSAEKLIDFVEVKPDKLQQYLREKKDMGYRLVGAEQTVDSTNLMDTKFDKKTVLVLGNEKAGIPRDIIPMLDQRIMIPQVGVVRLLNADVTGAICLWEYFRQHRSSSACSTNT